jgi:beta-lactamase regulating signal transducer with metallopeptidase domain
MNHTLQATAWTLIHFCWQAAAIAGLYRLASLATARRGSQARYLIALSALLAMFASALVTFAWEMRPIAPSPANFSAATAGDFPRIAAPGVISAMQEAPPRPAFADQIAGIASRPGLAAWITVWIVAFWLLGVLAFSLRSLGGWWIIQRLRASAVAEPSPAVIAAFERVRAALGLHKQVLLRVSSAVAGPVTVGTLRALVLLPLSAVTSLGADELEMVFAHELAHIRRADFLWNLVQTLVETLFFFHPAVWWISGRVRAERELCCDDLALSVCPNPVVYASALFHLEEQRSRQMRLAMALDGHQSPQTLRMRIARILGEPTAPAPRSVRPFSLAAVFAGLAVLLLSAPQLIAGLRPLHLPAPAVQASLAGQIHAALPSHMNALHAAPQAAKPSPAPPAQSEPTPQEQPPATADDAEQSSSDDKPQAEKSAPQSSGSKSSYIDRMKAAGYDVDLDKLISMKIQNVTPEYARAMGQVGLGKPTADELISCKIQGVSPEVIAQLKQQGLDVHSFSDAVSFRIFNVTPEFVAGMKAAGFDHIDSKQLISMRVQGVTPEFARALSQQFANITVEDLIKARIFRIDAAFVADAKKHGFDHLSFDKLVQLRISGLLDDESAK